MLCKLTFVWRIRITSKADKMTSYSLLLRCPEISIFESEHCFVLIQGVLDDSEDVLMNVNIVDTEKVQYIMSFDY